MAWLFARSQSARFLLRVEDLDPARSRREFERAQLDDLQALGLDWDGPIVRQSERAGLYDEALTALRAQGRLYPCFCTRAEIREAASAPHGDSPGRPGELRQGAYPGTCRRLGEGRRRAHLAAGRPFALRVDAEAERIAFEDRLLGQYTGVVDDFVVRRADGVPAYQLAVVVDDAAQGIGEVVRGADLAESTPRQILLARLLGLPALSYAHVALVLGPDGSRLAKRHGGATLGPGRRPACTVLTELAHSLGMATDRRCVSRPADLLDEFRPDALPREPVTVGQTPGD